MKWMTFASIIAVTATVVTAAACTSDDKKPDPVSTPPGSATPVPDAIDARIDTILSDGGPSFGEFNRDQLRKMMTVDTDAPFYMVNFIKFREFAAYRDGSDATLTGREANNRYNALPILLEIGARPVFVADVEQQLIGDDTKWDQVAIVRYPSRKAFVSLLERPDFQKLSVHKDAAVEKSTVLVTTMRGLPALPPVDPTTLPHPATADDKAFAMVHLMRFNERAVDATGQETQQSGRDALAAYEQAVGLAALPLGIRPAAVLEVEGVLIGDGRKWDEVRLNHFPSHGAFAALTGNPDWQSHQPDRARSLADSYSLITLPVVDSIAQP